MRLGQVIGGLIALIGGGLVLIQTLIFYEHLDAGGVFFIAWGINLVLSIIVMIAGAAGLAHKGGGGFVLASGIISIVMAIVSTMSIDFMFLLMQFTFFGSTLDIGPIGVVTIEAILIVIAGIILLVTPKEK